MHVRDQQEDEEPAVQAGGTGASAPTNQAAASAAPDAGDPVADGAVEFDERRAKMERLRAEGVNPYPAVSLWGTRTRITDVLAAHDASTLDHGEHPELSYQIAGRLISRRGHGKTAFLDIRDLSGSIQRRQAAPPVTMAASG